MTGVWKVLVAVLLLAGFTDIATQPDARRVKVNGMQMYYEVSGSGAPLVVLHDSQLPAR